MKLSPTYINEIFSHYIKETTPHYINEPIFPITNTPNQRTSCSNNAGRMSSMQRGPRLLWRVPKVSAAASLTAAESSINALRIVGIRLPANAITWGGMGAGWLRVVRFSLWWGRIFLMFILYFIYQ